MGIANLGVKMMDIKAWISNPKVIANSKKGYAHFDLRTDITKVSEYISNPEKVARHSFYPFIHYVMRMDKYNKKTGVKPKTREICYAAHMDRCIYQYYSATGGGGVDEGMKAMLQYTWANTVKIRRLKPRMWLRSCWPAV